MFSPAQIKLAANFLADGAKIVFASLVVGVFVPESAGAIPWLTFFIGILVTGVFLWFAILLMRTVQSS